MTLTPCGPVHGEQVNHLAALNGIPWILHAGAQWRELPERHGEPPRPAIPGTQPASQAGAARAAARSNGRVAPTAPPTKDKPAPPAEHGELVRGLDNLIHGAMRMSERKLMEEPRAARRPLTRSIARLEGR